MMKAQSLLKNHNGQLTDEGRALFGFLFGAIIMAVLVQFTIVNTFDFDNIQRSVRILATGGNPWVPISNWYEFSNPPHSVLFLWPMLFVGPRALQVLGGAFLFAIIFYQKTWTALAWFLTNSVLWVIGTGNVDMYVTGAGLLLLFAGDKMFKTKLGLALRVLGYGFLTVKPQGGVFIAGLYFLLRRDWKGLICCVLVYGVIFSPLLPGWLTVMIARPIVTGGTVNHSIWAGFGPVAAVIVAGLVAVSRRWKYWQLGGALAGVLTPYGMPSVPFFFMLTAIPAVTAIPVVILFSAGVVALTWFVSPPAGVPNPNLYYKTFLDIYNLAIIGFGLSLACLSRPTGDSTADDITLNEFLGRHITAGYLRLRGK